MSTLDPAVRDLLAAIHDALGRPDHNPMAVYTVRSAIYSALHYPLTSPVQGMAAWLRDETVAAADAQRVRDADRLDLYRAEELPA